jgi:predicted HTH transcriptional regulator
MVRFVGHKPPKAQNETLDDHKLPKVQIVQNKTLDGHKPPKVQIVQNETLDEILDLLQKELLEQIRLNPKITQKELSVALGVPIIRIKRTISVMRDKGLIARKEGKRFGYWDVRKY